MYVWDCAYRHFTLEFVSYLICVLVTAKAVSAHNHCILSLDLIFFFFLLWTVLVSHLRFRDHWRIQCISRADLSKEQHQLCTRFCACQKDTQCLVSFSYLNSWGQTEEVPLVLLFPEYTFSL